MASAGEYATIVGAATAMVSAVAAARSGSRNSKAEELAKVTELQSSAQELAVTGLRNLVDDLQEQLDRERKARRAAELELAECRAEHRRPGKGST